MPAVATLWWWWCCCTVTFILVENAYRPWQVKSRLWMFPTYILTPLLMEYAPELLIHHIEIHERANEKTKPMTATTTTRRSRTYKTSPLSLCIWQRAAESTINNNNNTFRVRLPKLIFFPHTHTHKLRTIRSPKTSKISWKSHETECK